MAANPYDQFDAPAANIFDRFDAKPVATTPSGIPGPRRSYAAADVPGAAVANLPRSAKQFATNLYEAVANPLQTVSAVLDVGAGALQKALPDTVVNFINRFEGNPAAAARAVEAANAVGGLYKDRYGSYDSIKRTLAEDPVGAAADLSMLFSGGSTLASKTSSSVAKALDVGARATSRYAPQVSGVLETGAATAAKVGPSVSGALDTAAAVTNPLTPVVKTAQFALQQKRKVLPSALVAEQQANAVRDATLRAAQSEGYVVTPGAVSPTGKNILAERIAGKTHLEQLASVQNQAVTDRLARQAVGLPPNSPLTSESMRQIRKTEFEKGYAPLNRVGSVATDSAFLDDLVGIEAKYSGAEGSFPGATPQKVGNLVKNYTVDKFQASDALTTIKTLREDAKGNFRSGDTSLGNAQIAMANALENQIERALTAANNPNAAKMLEQFRLSRQRMAISHSVEDAIKEGGGSVMAAKLARDIQSGKYVSGDIKTIAEFANVFPRVAQTPSQIGAPAAGTLLGRGLGGTVGGGVGYLMGDVAGAGIGAGIGGLAPEMVSAGMRNYLLSQTAQRRITPDYRSFADRLTSPQAARNALALQEAREIDLARRNTLAP
jgi:hypothetical protein